MDYTASQEFEPWVFTHMLLAIGHRSQNLTSLENDEIRQTNERIKELSFLSGIIKMLLIVLWNELKVSDINSEKVIKFRKLNKILFTKSIHFGFNARIFLKFMEHNYPIEYYDIQTKFTVMNRVQRCVYFFENRREMVDEFMNPEEIRHMVRINRCKMMILLLNFSRMIRKNVLKFDTALHIFEYCILYGSLDEIQRKLDECVRQKFFLL